MILLYSILKWMNIEHMTNTINTFYHHFSPGNTASSHWQQMEVERSSLENSIELSRNVLRTVQKCLENCLEMSRELSRNALRIV